jgi:hypothetical protein
MTNKQIVTHFSKTKVDTEPDAHIDIEKGVIVLESKKFKDDSLLPRCEHGFSHTFSEDNIQKVIDGNISFNEWFGSNSLSYIVQINEVKDPHEVVKSKKHNFAGNINNMDGLPRKVYIAPSLCEKFILLEKKEGKPGLAFKILMAGPANVFNRLYSGGI